MAVMGRSKFIVPQNKRDCALFIVFITVVPFVTTWELFFVIPTYHEFLDKIVVLHIISITFILGNLFGNLYFVMKTDASGRSTYLPFILKQGWWYCHVCQVNSPARSYHCNVCNECILKRDHHCMFIGSCVGYHNHRYFLVSMMYLFIAAVYGTIYHWQYVFSYVDGFSLVKLIYLTGPHFFYVIGWLSLSATFAFSLCTLCLMGVIMPGAILVQQCVAITHGQTQYERKNKITTYDLGWRRNFEEVMGSAPVLALLSPLFTSKLPGDGVKFHRGADEVVKDI